MSAQFISNSPAEKDYGGFYIRNGPRLHCLQFVDCTEKSFGRTFNHSGEIKDTG